jgi:hypothetical protein
MFVIEFLTAAQVANANGVDESDLPWTRVVGSWESFERADNEALWLSLDDAEYVYRVVEVKEQAA